MRAPVHKGKAGTEHQRPDDVGDENLTGGRLRRHPCADVNREAGNRILPVLNLAGVQPGPDLEPKLAEAVADIARAPDRARRAAERRQKTVAERCRSRPRRSGVARSRTAA